jgi:small subunit ribosomal protein S1
MEHYVPAYCPPCERYWGATLEEGPESPSGVSEPWEWVEAPDVPMEVWDEARMLQKRHKVLDLTVDGFNRGGLIAHWEDIECFIPASHLIDYPFPADPVAREECFQTFVGKTLRLCVIEVEPARKRLLLSERQVPECEVEEPEWPDWLCIGSICNGTVTSLRPFGAFVDIGPIEGMVHISEISWGRVRHPQDFLELGQEIRVKILNVDLEHQRVGLSIKRLHENPWDSVTSHFHPGDVVPGSVASVERFGLFVELMDGIEGLLHISELNAVQSSETLYRAYTTGQDIAVRILDIKPDDHRIALTIAEREG